ncbi:MAG: hypothetical protein [Caudoviricetes sp.]|nr:MAG: hypothetical protein [Caudoviricetes sp.]
MTTLKDHQHEMVAILAGSAVLSASGSRMAHALHDVLAYLNDTNVAPVAHTERRIDSTTPGLNDALLARDVEAVKPKRTSAEQQIAQLQNTIRQLRESNQELRSKCNYWYSKVIALPEQSGVRKEDTQVAPCSHNWACYRDSEMVCLNCGVRK